MRSQFLDIVHMSCAFNQPDVIPFVLARRKDGPPENRHGGAWKREDQTGIEELERSLDQFYTRDDVAEGLHAVFAHRFDQSTFRVVEPSAGAGAFFRLLPQGSVAFDLDPKMAGVRRGDFLAQDLGDLGPCLVVGNPPYGRCSELAVRFFNHAARWCQGIAMVLPRTFRKASIQNRLDPRFHLVCEVDVPKDAFYFRGRPYSVPTTFQVWELGSEAREKRPADTQHPDFEFLPPHLATHADLVVQRIGAAAGRLHHDLTANPNAHYFIKGDVEQTMRRLDLAGAAANVAGTPSLAKSEIVELYRADVATMAGRTTARRRGRQGQPNSMA